MRLPMLNGVQRNQQSVVALGGLNLTGTVGDGEWSWTQNVDAAQYPIARRRETRLLVGKLTKPNGLFALDALAFVDGTRFYYNGYYYGDVADSFKQMVGMGSDICIFPDKVIFSTKTLQFRPMEQRNAPSGQVRVTLAQADGSPFPAYTASAAAPEEPANGDWWLDTSGTPPVMKSWSESSGMWVDEYTTCVAVEAEGIGTGLKVDDAVKIAGLTDANLNGTWALLQADTDRIVFTGIIQETLQQNGGVAVSRETPEMDFIVEHNNRLWGCNSEKHEIYACALGDATNWYKYQGISTDSYAVTVGSPGPFTGAAVVNSSVCFFKENCIHKIYGTMPANFQMAVDHYRGAEKGSGGSIVKVNELVYYKSVFDVCAYDGTEVAGRSAALGVVPWRNAVAGRNGKRLYISMQDSAGTWSLFTLDTETGIWLREDGTQALAFTSLLTETFMLDAEGNVWALRSGEYAEGAYMVGPDFVIHSREETDAEVPWILRSGEILTRMANNKRIGKIQLLLELGAGAECTVRIRKDNEDWETALVVSTAAGQKRRYTLPIYPRRCDRLIIELSGTGEMMLYNMSWLVEAGSEYGR